MCASCMLRRISGVIASASAEFDDERTKRRCCRPGSLMI